jgi:hypothetical protein
MTFVIAIAVVAAAVAAMPGAFVTAWRGRSRRSEQR